MHTHERPRILKADETYTFRKYFDLKFDISDILQELEVSFATAEISLPINTGKIEGLVELQNRLHKGMRRVGLTSEAARREVLIAPILIEVAEIAEATIKIEYNIEVNQYLCGDLDYYLRSAQVGSSRLQYQLLVVEAKRADLTRGFTQMAVELIALDSWSESDRPIFYGAVTTGDIWQFGSFDRQKRLITQDLMLYRSPTDLELLMQILVGILSDRQ
jgi:hypothetical protein